MPLSREFALDILGLPTFASPDEIVLRYKTLSLMWFPENHFNYELALQEFSNISEAAVRLVFPEKTLPRKLKLPEMYGFFQYIFFGEKDPKEDEHDCDSDDISESSLIFEDAILDAEAQALQANDNATELIEEEAREKAKAEKRRSKKKKRKEKKKLEKLEKETNTEKPELKNGKADKTESKKSQDTRSSESEEDLDPTSAFVSVIARKHIKVPYLEVQEKEVSRKTRTSLPKEDHQSVVLRSRQLALRGNEMASLGHYSEATELFSESIGLDPSDHRFYGNRSYCYDRLGQYERALKDAEKSITLSPVWPKGYFRKGRALLGLKKYALAEQFFIEVLKLDNDCEDAIAELHKAKLYQIMEKGYSKDNAEAAISRHGTVSEALNSLVSTKVSRVPIQNDADIFISDDEDEPVLKPMNKLKVAAHLYDIKRDPNNPEGHTSLWVGNVQLDVTEKKLITMFGKFGDLLSVKLMPEKFCAFINYKNKSSPGKAMQAYQGMELSGYALVVRFPNLPGETGAIKKKSGPTSQETKTKIQGPVNGNECYFWRTMGCVYGEQCRYQHIKKHKGIDMNKK